MTRGFALLATGVLCAAVACDTAGEPGAVGETASERIELTAEAAEPIVEIAVAEGTPVAAGEVLLRQDPARAEANRATAAADLASARARLAELVRGPRSERRDAARANLAGAHEQLTFRQSELERIQQIFERNLLAEDVRDRAEAARDEASARLDVYEAELEELLAGTTVEELEQAEATVAAAEARLASAELSLERLTLRAPVAGVADSRLFELGERPAAGQPVMIVLGGSQPYARVFVPEEQRTHVRAGSKATVHVDGVARPFDGRVRWIASEAAFTPYYALTERDRGRLTYMAKIDILGADERLPDGVPVRVEFPDSQ
jgi:HlyD family secretion protein